MSKGPIDRIAPYLLLGETRRRALEAALLDRLTGWRRLWAGPTAKPVTLVLEADYARLQRAFPANARLVRACLDGCSLVDMIVSADALAAMAGGSPARVGSGAVSASDEEGLAAALLFEMMGSLGSSLLEAARLQGTIQKEKTQVPESLRQVKSGRHVGAMVSFNGSAASLLLLIAPRFIEAFAPGRVKPRHLDNPIDPLEALQEEAVRVEASLGQTEIHFGDLACLAPGQVILLQQPLSQPIRLFVGDAVCFAEGKLGRMAGKQALQISKTFSAGNTTGDEPFKHSGALR